MRKLGITAAVLLLVLGLGFAVLGGGAERAEAHSCSAVDKRFIQTASTNMDALSVWSEGYRKGEIGAEEVAMEAEDAAKRVGYVKPLDPALKQSQELIDGMFREYSRAVTLAAKERDRAGLHMQRSYGLANFARDVLLQAPAGAHEARLRRRPAALEEGSSLRLAGWTRPHCAGASRSTCAAMTSFRREATFSVSSPAAPTRPACGTRSAPSATASTRCT